MHAGFRVPSKVIRFPIPAPEHAMTNTILAIDLAEFNSVLSHYDPDTRQASIRTANGEYRMVDEGSRSVADASGS